MKCWRMGVPFAVLVGLASVAWGQSTILSEPDTTQHRFVPKLQEPQRHVPALARKQRIVAIRYPQAEEGVDQFRASVPELVSFANKETRLEDVVFVAEGLRLTDPLLGTPLLLFLTGNQTALNLSPKEKTWLGSYLRGGGLLYAEDVRGPTIYPSDVAQSGTPFDVQLKALLADRLVLGDRVHWTTVRNNHPIYHAFFEFPAGPPLSTSSGSRRSDRVRELEMLELRGRVVAIFSDLNISYGWASTEIAGHRRALQFGTNLLIFALAEKRGGPLRH